jgi:hypothetical protein
MLQTGEKKMNPFGAQKGRGKRSDNGPARPRVELYDVRPYAGNESARLCAAAVVAGMNASPDACQYVIFDSEESVKGRFACAVLTCFPHPRPRMAHIFLGKKGKSFAVPGHSVDFFELDVKLDRKILEDMLGSCYKISVPGFGSIADNDMSRESFVGALHIALARARLFIPFQPFQER